MRAILLIQALVLVLACIIYIISFSDFCLVIHSDLCALGPHCGGAGVCILGQTPPPLPGTVLNSVPEGAGAVSVTMGT